MKKRFLIVLLLLSIGVLLIFTACDMVPKECVHQYAETVKVMATCNQDGVKEFRCISCGDSYEEAIKGGHIWVNATCTTPKTCKICLNVQGEMLGHEFVDNICTRCEHSIRWTYEELTDMYDYASSAYNEAGVAWDYAFDALTAGSMFEKLYYQSAIIELFDVMNYLANMKNIACLKADINLNGGEQTTLREEVDNLYNLCVETTNIEITDSNYSSIFSNITDIKAKCLDLQIACLGLLS